MSQAWLMELSLGVVLEGACSVQYINKYLPGAVPNPNEGVEDEAAPPEEAPAPPNSPPAGLGASPSFFPNAKPPPLPKADGVDDAPA